jgi:hypothetical protein
MSSFSKSSTPKARKVHGCSSCYRARAFPAMYCQACLGRHRVRKPGQGSWTMPCPTCRPGEVDGRRVV